MATIDAARARSALLWLVLLAAGFAGGWWAPKPQAAPAPAPLLTLIPPPPGCVHIDGSAYECPGREAWTERVSAMIQPGQVLRGQLTLTLRDTTFTYDLPVENLDAIFLTKSSLGILIEHYEAIHDTVKARDLKAYRDSLP